MRKKAAIELSLSFIVTIIIALVVFAGGIYFIRNLFSEAQETQAMLDQQTEDEIKSLLAGGEILAVPISQKTIRIGSQDVFWVAIANVLLPEQGEDYRDFYVLIGFDNAYKPDGEYIQGAQQGQSHINSNWLLYDKGPHRISINDNKPVSLLVSVKPEMTSPPQALRTQAGLYAFNVCVFADAILGEVDETNCWNTANRARLYPDQRPRRFIVEVK